MLPTKVLQMDYQDFGDFVWSHFDLIEDYQKNNNIKIDGVVSKLRNGTIPGAIIANHFNIPMGVINAPRKTNYSDFELFIPKELKGTTLLYVDSICGTGETLNAVKLFFKDKYPEINLITYSTLVDVRASYKPDILGLVHEMFFQPPWEWRSFTAQTHLDRLLNGDIKASEETYYSIGFSSEICKSKVEQSLGKKLLGDWIEVFNDENVNRKMQTVSGISSLDIPEKLTLELCKTKFNPLINEKVNFIQSNGFTHFIENDWSQSFVISEKCPTCNMIYFDGKNLYKIYTKEITKEKLSSLKFD